MIKSFDDRKESGVGYEQNVRHENLKNMADEPHVMGDRTSEALNSSQRNSGSRQPGVGYSHSDRENSIPVYGLSSDKREMTYGDGGLAQVMETFG